MHTLSEWPVSRIKRAAEDPSVLKPSSKRHQGLSGVYPVDATDSCVEGVEDDENTNLIGIEEGVDLLSNGKRVVEDVGYRNKAL